MPKHKRNDTQASAIQAEKEEGEANGTAPVNEKVKGSSENKPVSDFQKRKQEYLKKHKPSTDYTPPSKNRLGSPNENISHKVYTGSLQSGEVIAWVADRYAALKPAYILCGLKMLSNMPDLMEKARISVLLRRRSEKDSDAEWGYALSRKNGAPDFILHWQFLVRFQDGDEVIDLDGRQKWGKQLAVFFETAEKNEKKLSAASSPSFAPQQAPNTFVYAGDTNPTGTEPLKAGNIFMMGDVLSRIMQPQFQKCSADICKEDWLLKEYFSNNLCEKAKSQYITSTTAGYSTPNSDGNGNNTDETPEEMLMAAFND
jgi:hypothetical protein